MDTETGYGAFDTPVHRRLRVVERELIEARRTIELYTNVDRTRQRAEAERDAARTAITVMIEQLQLSVSFEAWREHRLYVEPTDARRNDWRERAWQALHTMPELGSRYEGTGVGLREVREPGYPGDRAELDGIYNPD